MAAPAARASRTAPASISLDLDKIEHESPEPFVVKIDGKRITFISIEDLDWQTASNLSPDRPYQFFEEVIPTEDQEAFLAAKFPLWKMRRLTQDYQKHYGLVDEGNSEG